jgi:hypothetical protein
MLVRLMLGCRRPMMPLALIAIMAMCLISASTARADVRPPASATEPAAQNCITDGTGEFKADVHGGVVSSLEWGNEGTACTGFTSPSGPIRLQFSRRTDDGELVIDLTIRGVAEGQKGRSFNGSVAFSGSALEGKTFKTSAEACRFTLVENTLVSATLLERIYKLVGNARCSSPAKADSPGAEIKVREVRFTGQTRWLK